MPLCLDIEKKKLWIYYKVKKKARGNRVFSVLPFEYISGIKIYICIYSYLHKEILEGYKIN